MKFVPLVWAMLWRRKTRTVLTFASIAVAFMLFGMLQAFGSLFADLDSFTRGNMLMTSHRYGFIKPLPYAQRSQIEAVAGVKDVTPLIVMPLLYQDPNQAAQPSFAADPATLWKDDPRFVVAPDVMERFRKTRTGLVAGRQLAEKYGWKVGDHIPMFSPLVKRKDGADHWEFDVVGFFDFNKELLGEGVSAMRSFVRYDYVDESRAGPQGTVDLFFLTIQDASQAVAVSKAVDAVFQNSANPTKTQTEAEQQREQVEQLGDIGLIIRSILAAVFFTLAAVAGNTMMRAFRERIPELAVLKTLGFHDRTVATLVACESLLLCVAGGVAGLALAYLVLKPIARAIASVLPLMRMGTDTVLIGVALSVALGLLATAIPAWQSARLSVVAALARR
jgi:putative ABC transport system permease protein